MTKPKKERTLGRPPVRDDGRDFLVTGTTTPPLDATRRVWREVPVTDTQDKPHAVAHSMLAFLRSAFSREERKA